MHPDWSKSQENRVASGTGQSCVCRFLEWCGLRQGASKDMHGNGAPSMKTAGGVWAAVNLQLRGPA